MLRAGGNAADAAVAAALVLYVVEPHFCGAGGDGFFIWSEPGADPVGLDGSGAFPARRLTEEALRADGLGGPLPGRGPRSVTVPGALALLEEAIGRFGSLSLSPTSADRRSTSPARSYEARQNALAPVAAERAAAELAADPVLAPLYVPGERPVGEGQRLTNGALAELLSEFASNRSRRRGLPGGGGRGDRLAGRSGGRLPGRDSGSRAAPHDRCSRRRRATSGT